jgi:hypothetical protein
VHSGFQSAAQLHDNRVWVRGDESADDPVQHSAAYRHRNLDSVRQLKRADVEAEATMHLVGQAIPEQWPGCPGVQRAARERDEQCLFDRGQVVNGHCHRIPFLSSRYWVTASSMRFPVSDVATVLTLVVMKHAVPA